VFLAGGFLAGNFPIIRPYTVYIHGSGQPYVCQMLAGDAGQEYKNLVCSTCEHVDMLKARPSLSAR